MPILIDKKSDDIQISNGLIDLMFSDGELDVIFEGAYEGSRMCLNKDQTLSLYEYMKKNYDSK